MKLHKLILHFAVVLTLVLCRALAAEASVVCMGDQHLMRVTRVVDGDTVWADPLHAGSIGPFGLIYTGRVRLLDVWAPEMNEEGGPQAATWMKERLPEGTMTCTRYTGLDNFGRPLVVIYLPGSDASLNTMIVAAGLATRTRQ